MSLAPASGAAGAGKMGGAVKRLRRPAVIDDEINVGHSAGAVVE